MFKILVQLLAFPSIRMGRILGELLGDILWLTHSKPAKVTLINIQLCFPELTEKEQRQLARKSLQETSKLIFEIPKIYSQSNALSLLQLIKETNKEILDAALASDRSTIVLVPHLGNWEIMGHYLALQKPITVLYLPPKNEEHHQYIIQGRNKGNTMLAPANRKGVTTLLKAVKNGEFIGILPDQEPDLDGGEFAPFFNIPTLTMTLVHKLVQKSNCHIVMGFSKRIPDGFDTIFMQPDPDIYNPDCQTSLAGLNKSVENCVRLAPEQYQWEYKRFRKHPSGQKHVYYKKGL